MMKRAKNHLILMLTALACAATLAVCNNALSGDDSSGGSGTLIIGNGGNRNAARTAVPDAGEIAGMTYKVTASGPGGNFIRDLGPEGGAIPLAAGNWQVDVKAYNSSGNMRGWASTSVRIVGGENAQIPIPSVVGVKTETELKDVLIGAAYANDPINDTVIIVQESFPLTGDIDISGGRKFTFAAAPGTNAVIKPGYNRILIDGASASLTLGRRGSGTLTFDGETISVPQSFITVENGGNLAIEDGAEIINIKNTMTSGGAVVLDTGSRLTMNGGSIMGNQTNSNGGAVYVVGSGATFIMSGGSITGNQANSDGGAVVVGGYGNFIMSGGSITGNQANSGGGAVVVDGNGNFTMDGGDITGNQAGYGGAVNVYIDGRFTMSGGGITDNRSTSTFGAVLVGGIFTMSGGSITDNQANGSGGAVAVNDSTASFTMSNGTIGRNTANDQGGGVYIYSGTFGKTGGIIYGSNGGANANYANSAGDGHAVFYYYYPTSAFRDNTAGPGYNMNVSGGTATGIND